MLRLEVLVAVVLVGGSDPMVRVAGRVEALDTRSSEVFLGRRIGRFKRSGERSAGRGAGVVSAAEMLSLSLPSSRR